MDPQVEKILKLPTKQKILILIVVVVLEAAALVWFLYVPKHKELVNLKVELTRLQAEIDDKTRIANNLPRLQPGQFDL